MSEPVNMFTIALFFMDDPNLVKKGLNSYESGRVKSVTVAEDCEVVGRIGASMKKKVYDVRVCSLNYSWSLVLATLQIVYNWKCTKLKKYSTQIL